MSSQHTTASIHSFRHGRPNGVTYTQGDTTYLLDTNASGRSEIMRIRQGQIETLTDPREIRRWGDTIGRFLQSGNIVSALDANPNPPHNSIMVDASMFNLNDVRP